MVKVIQQGGLHIRDVRDVLKPPKETKVGEFRRSALEKEFNGDILEACAKLQSLGKLAGPERNIASQVVGVLTVIAANLTKFTQRELARIKRKILKVFMLVLDDPLDAHEAHLKQFRKKKPPLKNIEEICDEFMTYNPMPDKFKKCPSLESGQLRENRLAKQYDIVLRAHLKACFTHERSYGERQGFRVMESTAENCGVTFDEDLSSQALILDGELVSRVENAYQLGLMALAFPEGNYARLAKTNDQLCTIVFLLQKHGWDKFEEYHLHVRDSVKGVLGHAANNVVKDIIEGYAVLPSLTMHFGSLTTGANGLLSSIPGL